MPGSRLTVNAFHSALAFGGPTHSTDEKSMSTTSGRYPNAPCPAIEPRLSPYKANWGRRSAGHCSQRSWIASTIARPASTDFC